MLQLFSLFYTYYTNDKIIYICVCVCKGKVIPLQAMKAHGGYEYKGPHIHCDGTRKRGWLYVCSGALTPEENPHGKIIKVCIFEVLGRVNISGHWRL